MPTAIYTCDHCGAVFDRWNSFPPQKLRCILLPEGCPGWAVRPLYDFELPRVRRGRSKDAQPFDPVVVHRDAQGNYRFPGSPDAPVPTGFQRIELRTTEEVRRLERDVNRHESGRHEQAAAREEGFYAGLKSRQRAELRAAMARMSPTGRAFAEEAMRASDDRPRGRFDAEFHVEAFSQDSSNREPQRDASTGWRPRKG